MQRKNGYHYCTFNFKTPPSISRWDGLSNDLDQVKKMFKFTSTLCTIPLANTSSPTRHQIIHSLGPTFSCSKQSWNPCGNNPLTLRLLLKPYFNPTGWVGNKWDLISLLYPIHWFEIFIMSGSTLKSGTHMYTGTRIYSPLTLRILLKPYFNCTGLVRNDLDYILWSDSCIFCTCK